MHQTKKIDYQAGDTTLEAYCAYEDTTDGKRPGILIAHDWSGRNDFACRKAEALADLGYVGFALDMFGKGKIGNTKEEKSALIKPLIEDRTLLQQRMLAGLETLKSIEAVDKNRIAAIGFCFGGLCVLDLARSGAAIKGVVSFHGLLNAPEEMRHHTIKAKILALHGYDDPMVTPDQVMAFADEMTEAHADWQLTMYGHTMHAFTNPQAHDKDFGTVYDQKADARSWIAMKDFFSEIFS